MSNNIVCSVLRGLALVILLIGANPTFAQDDMVWNPVDPYNTVYLQLQEGTVVIELNPAFAPKTVKRFKELLEEQFYRSLSFYRVIDGFVAQGGDESDIDDNPAIKTLNADFCRIPDGGHSAGLHHCQPQSLIAQ